MSEPSRQRGVGRGAAPAEPLHGGGFGTFEWDLVSGSVTWSAAMYRIHGIDRDGFDGTPEAYLQFVHPEDLDTVQEIIGHLLRGGEPHPVEYRIRRPDGEVRHVLGTNEIVHLDNGRPVRVVGTVRDVSALRPGASSTGDPEEVLEALHRGQERFRALIEHSFDVITVFDFDGIVLYTTPSCRRVLGYEPEELIGRPGYELVHPDDREEAGRIFDAALSDPDSVTRVVHRIRHKDGSYRAVEILGTNLLGHPAVRGLVSNLRDITERQTLEEALRQAQKMEAVGRLAGGVAHDFNNLLTVILGEVDMALAGGSARSELAPSLSRIRASGERAAALTRQLLSFSRRELVAFEALDLNRLVSEAGDMLRPLIGEDMELELDLDPGVWRLRGDRSQLDQLLINLVVNARDSMPEGGVLRIATSNVTIAPGEAPRLSAGEYVRLVVADCGVGMPEEIRAHVFEPFFTTKADKGTGFGLATCYSVAKQHGGRIDVASVEGVGTTITVLLPRALAKPPPIRAGGHAATTAGSERILLVEDEEAVREVTARMLEEAGYEVVTAADSDEAMDRLGEAGGTFDLLITDVVLTGVGGRELAETITGRHPEIRVLYVSGYTDDSILRRGLVDRDVTLVRKPFTAVQLAAQVRAVLDAG